MKLRAEILRNLQHHVRCELRSNRLSSTAVAHAAGVGSTTMWRFLNDEYKVSPRPEFFNGLMKLRIWSPLTKRLLRRARDFLNVFRM